MTVARPDEPAWRMPRYDYWLLPLIFVSTILVLLAGGEVAARILYPQVDAAEPCEVHTAAGYRYKPECTSHTKVWEGPWITQHFNECGYRATESCAVRPPGSLRVVVVGSSTARGALVNYPQSFAARASKALSRECGGLVDFQNLASEPPDINRIDQRMPEILGLHPSAIVLVVGPYDLAHLMDNANDAAHANGGQANKAQARFHLSSLINLLRDSRLFLLTQYYLYRDPAFQVHAFLLNSNAADYVRRPLSLAWRQHVDDFGALLGRITATDQGTPLLAVYAPERAQVALAREDADLANGVSPGDDRRGIDPYVLGEALARTAAAHGAHFADATRTYADSPDFKSEFYLTDGHPRPAGHAALARVVERGLLSEPAFARCNAARVARQ